ncbi:hypothetical protein OEZ85_009181 [Tetradesmus obliquus]|uniref:Adenylate kinase n=1 Tax=Tetradesmus obliquus TaxID=3088 RepID=A0ABY8TL05_TETOB|nr:hypothetical protein OEZ85_009181 [Tetradesmus obliquus]
MHRLWRAAWEGQQPLQLHGEGRNRLPTLHVQDLAAFAEAVVLQQPAGRYLLACDEEAVSQAELLGAVGQLLGNKQMQTLSGDATLLQPAPSPLLLLDLPFSASSLPQPGEMLRCCPRGLLGHLPLVLQQLLQARGLTPLRILIRGPPAAGKTHLAQRLAQLYGLLHINTAAVLAELPLMDAETQKAAHTQLASREGRISQPLLARMAQHLLARQPAAANQGWVMEGWMRSLAAAQLLTCSAAGGMTAAEKAANRRTTGGSVKSMDKKKSGTGTAGSSSSKEAAEAAGSTGGRTRRSSTAGDECSLAAESSTVQLSPELLPHFLIETSHNNEKEFMWRLESYKQLLQEDAADLAAKRGAILSALQAASHSSAASSHDTPGRAARATGEQRSTSPSKAAAANAAAAAAAPDASALPPDVKLPEHGGFVAFFEDAGLQLPPALGGKGAAAPGSSWLDLGLDKLAAAAEALAAEKATRDQQRLQAAARPLAANLMGGVLPAVMAGLVKVALSRPADPCQVIADELLAAAAQLEATYADPYDAPVYSIQLAKVEAKAAREAARAAAAAAKAAREEAAAAAAAAAVQQEAEAAAAVSSFTAGSMGSFAGPPAVPTLDTATAAAGGGSQPPTRPGSAVVGSNAASRAAVRTSAAATGSPGRSVKPTASVRGH